MDAWTPAAVLNFRDIGGLRAADGRVVKRRLLYRSGQFDVLAPAEIEWIVAARFRLRCDLRSAPERSEHPGVWPDATEPGAVLAADLGADPRAANRVFIHMIRADASEQGAAEAMKQFQRDMAVAVPQPFRRLVTAIIDEHRLPAVIHCRFGKDRTGLVVALLLKALDVPHDQIIEDYLASNRYLDTPAQLAKMREMIEGVVGHPVDDAVAHAVLSVRPIYLDAALEVISDRCGSIAGFLADEAGLDAGRLETLRSILLEPDAGHDSFGVPAWHKPR